MDVDGVGLQVLPLNPVNTCRTQLGAGVHPQSLQNRVAVRAVACGLSTAYLACIPSGHASLSSHVLFSTQEPQPGHWLVVPSTAPDQQDNS
jgi:hypothetical protein